MNNCKECKYWLKHELVGWGRIFGECTAIDDDQTEQAAVLPGDYAYTEGRLITRPEFGCTLFEGQAEIILEDFNAG